MDDIEEFLNVNFGSDPGSGLGSGSGSSSGSSSGSGTGYGPGSGTGASQGDGDGSGDGSGYGYDYGHGQLQGQGSGYGDGNGQGSGYCDGSGYGYGFDDGVMSFNGRNVYMVDGISTIIDTVHGNVAKGETLESDLTLRRCYIARSGNFFAHGKTLRRAVTDARNKALKQKPISERIKAFADAHKSLKRKYNGQDLFDWHGVLTGSCRLGRESWCRSHGLSPDKDKLTVSEFCKLTCNAYGGDVIRELARTMGVKL